ncbi:Bifunctional protein [Yarrowia sp. B02]|nr:Bifunctional protein [Yarrowia sp. B02]
MTYTFSKGFRKVIPYYYTHSVPSKGRWFGKTVIEVLSTELASVYPAHHLRSTIDAGNVKLIRRDKISEPAVEYTGWNSLSTQVFKNGSILESRVHKHEPSVPGDGKHIKIVFQDEDLLVVDKPAGIPVHPTGKYLFNSVKEILKHETEVEELYPAHRLDKNTTGVLVFAKSSESVNTVTQQIMSRTAKKEYLARVKGKFPASIETHEPVLENTTKRDAAPKDAHTAFELVRYDDTNDYSVVKCLPSTGRNHQIRQHLRHLGFPIENDREYNPELEGVKRREKVEDYICDECGFPVYQDYHDTLYLHAFKYTLDEGVFETDYPQWAL